MRRATVLISLIAVALAIGRCSNDERARETGDSRTTGDASHTPDMSNTGDTGNTVDTSSALDTSSTADTSNASDSGNTDDSGGSDDTGPVTTCTRGSGSTRCRDNWASPCGGDPIGSWTLATACLARDVGILGICTPGTITDNSTVSGSLTFDGSLLTREVKFNISLDLHIPPACTGDGTVACSTLPSGMTPRVAAIGGEIVCSDDGSRGCDCTLTAQVSDVSIKSYVIDGSEVVTDPGLSSERRWAYCVADGVLTARESGGDVAEEDVVQVYSCAD